MNSFLIRAFVKKIKSENMNNNNYQKNYEQYFSNDPNNDTDAYNENNMIDKFIDMVMKHDYSYHFSDDDRWYRSGVQSEKNIEELLHALVTIVKVDAERLLEDCLYEREEQYTDGLTHKIIRNWFKPYVANVNNIFVKPKFNAAKTEYLLTEKSKE